ncbi:unnamed protein product [Trichobilharzia regenti]|nr:unnamed protein product [Trichobilharzia regenti]
MQKLFYELLHFSEHSFTDLSHDIESVSQGNVQRLLLCLVKAERDNITVDVKKNGERYSWLPFMNATLAKLEAHAIHKALKSKRRNEQAVLSDIFCKRTPYQLNMTSVYYETIDLRGIGKAYNKLYNSSLVKDLKKKSYGCYRKILLSLLRGNYHPKNKLRIK